MICERCLEEIRQVGKSYQLEKTDHGIDGWDARTWTYATFSTRDKAIKWLEKHGYTYIDGDNYRHHDVKKRHTMGEITFKIKPTKHLAIDPED